MLALLNNRREEKNILFCPLAVRDLAQPRSGIGERGSEGVRAVPESSN